MKWNFLRERDSQRFPPFYGDEMEDFCFMIDDEMEDAMHCGKGLGQRR